MNGKYLIFMNIALLKEIIEHFINAMCFQELGCFMPKSLSGNHWSIEAMLILQGETNELKIANKGRENILEHELKRHFIEKTLVDPEEILHPKVLSDSEERNNLKINSITFIFIWVFMVILINFQIRNQFSNTWNNFWFVFEYLK